MKFEQAVKKSIKDFMIAVAELGDRQILQHL